MSRSYWVLLCCVWLALAMGPARGQDSAPELFTKAQTAIDNRQFTTALAHLNECLRKDPFYTEAYFWRGQMRQRSADRAGAITDYNIFLESHPQHAEALFARANARLEEGHYALARDDFKRLMHLSSSETNTVFFQVAPHEGTKQMVTAQSALRAVVYGSLGLIDLHTKNYPRAVAYLDSALALQPNTDYLLNQALALHYGGQSAKALAVYERVLQAEPRNALAKHNLAQLTKQYGTARQAENLLTQAIDDNPKLPFAYAERAFLRLNNNDLAGALNDYNQAIVLDNQEPDYFVNRGIVLEKMKRYPEAIRNYDQAIKIRNTYSLAWLNRGNAHVKLNRIKEALDDYSVAIAFAPDYGLAFLNRAVAYEKMKRPVEACRDAKKAETLGMTVSESFKKAVCR